VDTTIEFVDQLQWENQHVKNLSIVSVVHKSLEYNKQSHLPAPRDDPRSILARRRQQRKVSKMIELLGNEALLCAKGQAVEEILGKEKAIKTGKTSLS